MRGTAFFACIMALLAAAVRLPADDVWKCPETGQQFYTGALPTPESQLAQAPLFSLPGLPPKHVAYVPKYRSNFGNNRYGVCVNSEEAFAKSCWIPAVQPSIEIPEQTVIDWARRHGVLNGANLGSVADWMAQKGFQVGEQLYNDGPKALVDYRDDVALKAAIAMGPVKVAIPARMLGSGAGSRDGWYAVGGRSGGSDHCVSLCGYGDAQWLYGELDKPLPAAVKPDMEGYLCYTWSTIGFVDAAWVRGNVREAWIRQPTTVGIPPIVPPLRPVPLRSRLFQLLLVLLVGLLLGVLARVLLPFLSNLFGIRTGPVTPPPPVLK